MNPRMNVLELANRCRKIKPTIQETTWKNWMKAVKPIQDVDVSTVDIEFVWDYVDSQTERLSEGTVKQRVGFLSGIWNRGIKRRMLTENPWHRAGSDLKASRSAHPFREWQFYEHYHQDPLFLLLWFHGFRVGEIAGIKQEDVMLDATIPYFNLVHYERPFRRLKNDMSIRQVPIHPACQRMVRNLRFPLSRDVNGPGRSWGETFRYNLGLPPGEGAHSLRHNFESRMRATDPNPAAEARLLGHTFPNMTARYGTVLPQLLFETLCRIPDPR